MGTKRKVGRPTKFKKEFCQLLIDHMAKGLSFESFGGHPQVRVATSNTYEWRDKHPEFQEAFKKGSAASCYYLESLALNASLRPKELPVNTGLFVFLLKNRLGWKDKVEQSFDGDSAPVFTLNYKLDE